MEFHFITTLYIYYLLSVFTFLVFIDTVSY